MKRKITLLLAIFILVSGCTVHTNNQPSKKANIEAKPMPSKDFIPKNIKVVAVGDSLTQGVGDSTNRGGYIPYLKDIMENEKGIGKVTFQNFGVRGDRTDQLLIKLKQPKVMNEIKNADMVIITIGGNDVMKVFKDNFTSLKVSKFQTALAGYETKLNNIIKTIREYKPNVGIVLIGIYNPFGKWFSDIKEMDDIVSNWNNASEQILTQYYNTQFIPVSDIFENQNENLFYTDDFHPNDLGYKLMANRIGDYLRKNKLEQLRK
ncbi:SGNH/GDSL hydrolase family protein [Bacillus sp. FJAT-49736]|uniref:SGNH/GDSL hydrolase family protein n=1 Tax=Bacillus sp. FJAT-49736 TaxID=2833582 RepID=UPI001BC94A31|nr:SGNH/GDSL hydrolase family protein [Bacillus sp. FJAT-49736]MBS4173193.1 SGNH/GDSL hydrolase family protein [Bacillus sp. FJAT-49736]